MKNNKKLNLILFVVIFGFSNVSHAGIITRGAEVLKRWWNGADSSLDNAARDAGNGTSPVHQNPNTPSKLVTENANGAATEVRMIDFINKVNAKSNVIGVDYFSAEVARVLMRKSKAAPIVVAEAGTGKSANIEYIQHLINTRDPIVSNLHGKQLYFLDVYKLMGGTQLRGSFEERLAAILKEMASPENANKIIVIDELENVLSNELGVKFLESMKSYLTSDMEVKLIFNITPGPYDKLMRDPQLVRRMSPIYKDPPGLGVVRNILLNIRNSADVIDGVKISNQQIEQILNLSQLHTTLRNPDVAITMLNDAINNAIADRMSGNLQIVKLRTGLQSIQGEIKMIEGMRTEGVARSFGPHFDSKLNLLSEKEKTISAVINSFGASFRAVENLRNLMEQKIIARRTLKLKQNQNLANDVLGEPALDGQIDELNTEIQNLAAKIKAENPLLVSTGLEEQHIVSAATTNLNRDDKFVRQRMNGAEPRQATVDRVAERLNGRHSEAVNAIVRREMAQRMLGQDGGIPAFLIINKSIADSDKLANSVVLELTGAKPYRLDSLEVRDAHSLSRHTGSDVGLIGSDVEGPIFKEARLTGGHLGILFSGIQNAISDLRGFVDRIATSRILTSNKGERVSFEKSTLFLTLSDMPELTLGQKAILNQLPTETAQQNYLREYVKLNYSGKLKQGEFGVDAARMEDELLNKIYVIYLDDSVILDDQFKAVVSETLKSKALQGAFDRHLNISVDFSDQAINYLFNVLKNSGSNDVNRVLVTEVMGYLDDLIQRRQIISGDHLVINLDGKRLVAETLDWADGSRRANALSYSESLTSPGNMPDARRALEDALKLIED